MSESLEVRITRVNKTFRPGERVSGTVLIRGGGSVSHSGLTLRAMGSVRPQNSAAGMNDPSRTVLLSDVSIEMAPAGRLPSDIALPFEFTLEPLAGRFLTETYHGVYVTVKYVVIAMLGRTGFMSKPLEGETEFVVEVPVSIVVVVSSLSLMPLSRLSRLSCSFPSEPKAAPRACRL